MQSLLVSFGGLGAGGKLLKNIVKGSVADVFKQGIAKPAIKLGAGVAGETAIEMVAGRINT